MARPVATTSFLSALPCLGLLLPGIFSLYIVSRLLCGGLDGGGGVRYKIPIKMEIAIKVERAIYTLSCAGPGASFCVDYSSGLSQAH